MNTFTIYLYRAYEKAETLSSSQIELEPASSEALITKLR
jgi:hypothetical protein